MIRYKIRMGENEMLNRDVSRVFSFIMIIIFCLGILMGCTTRQNQDNENIVIGYSMTSLRDPIWQKNNEAMLQKAEELGVELRTVIANNNIARQIAQSKELVDQGVDVLIIVPTDSNATSEIVDYAHSKGVPVIAYEGLIYDAPLDAYVSADHEEVGRQQAEYVTKINPTGNYVYIGGAPNSPTAVSLRKGALEALQSYIDAGEIRLVLDKMTADWSPALAREYMTDALDITNNNITAVIAANDRLADAVNTALTEKGLEGQVLVTGGDADLAALRRIVQGLQTMTVFEPIDELTSTVLNTAITLAKNEKPPTNTTVYNGQVEVPSYLIKPIAVDKDNMLDIIIRPGYETFEDVYL